MLLLLAVVVAIVTVPPARGRLAALGGVRLRLVPAIFAAVALQIAVISVFPGGSPGLHRVLHVASYGLAAAFLVANRKFTGMWLVALGAALNLAAIVANGGVMPAAPGALRTAGLPVDPAHFRNSTAVTHARLQFLGDVFAVPKGWPLANVYSVGDVLIAVGIVVVIHGICGSRLVRAGRRTRPEAGTEPISAR